MGTFTLVSTAPDSHLRPLRSALVLGGGGITGIAWMLGLLKGLRDAGVDLTGATTVVGTSAGSVVGAQVTSGHDLDALYAGQLEPPDHEIGAGLAAGAILDGAALAEHLRHPGGQSRIGLGRIGQVILADEGQQFRPHHQQGRAGGDAVGNPVRGQEVPLAPEIRAAEMNAARLDRQHVDRQQVGVADEAGDKGIRRPVVNIVGTTDLQDLTAAHDADAVGQHHRFFQVMGDMDEGDTELAVQALQFGLQHFLQLDVER